MRIGFLLPATHALDGVSNGVRSAAIGQAEALRRLGHDSVYLDPWNLTDPASLDCVHFFQGGCGHYQIEHKRPHPVKMLTFAPQIDTNERIWKYRLAAEAGRLLPKFFTIPRLFKDQCQGCDAVMARSLYDRDRIVRGLGINPSKVEIVLNGIDPPPMDADPALARTKFNLPAEYALHVSRYATANKNAVALCEAVAPTGLPLYLAGPPNPGPILDRLYQLAAQHKNIAILGFMDRPALQSLYAGCKVFCLPSHHEGTGLVALEAAVYGAEIVITSKGGPPDYFLNWAHYCDPASIESIRAAFKNAWQQPRRTELRDHVLKNLTWDCSARSLAAAIEKHRPRN